MPVPNPAERIKKVLDGVRRLALRGVRRERRPYVLTATDAGLCACRIQALAGRARIERFHWQGGARLEDLPTLQRSWSLPAGPVAALLSAQDYLTLVVDDPPVPEDELARALVWQLRDRLPFPPEEAVLGRLSLPQQDKSTSWVAVARRDVCERLHAAYRDTGLHLRAIDVEEGAQRNLAALIEPAGGAICLLHVGARDALLTVNAGSELLLSRRLERRAGEEDDDRLALEVQRVLDYADRHLRALAIARLYLAPLPGQDEHCRRLEGLLTVPVQPLRLDAIMDPGRHEPLADLEVQRQAWFALGLALRWA